MLVQKTYLTFDKINSFIIIMYIQSARTNKQTNIVHYDLYYIGLQTKTFHSVECCISLTQ